MIQPFTVSCALVVAAVLLSTGACDSGGGDPVAPTPILDGVSWGDTLEPEDDAVLTDQASSPGDASLPQDLVPDTPSPADLLVDSQPDAPLLVDVDAASPMDAEADADTGPEPETLPPTLEAVAGGIFLSELDSTFFGLAGAAARFTDPAAAPAPLASFGACEVRATSPMAVEPVTKGYDAGVITVTGTSPMVTLSPVNEGALGTGYSSSLPQDLEDLLPSGGGSIQVQGAGGSDISTFQVQLIAPDEVDVTDPSTLIPDHASTSGALEITWKAGNGHEVLVTLTPADSSYEAEAGYMVSCLLSGDTGVTLIPAQALDMMRDGANKQNALFGVTRLRVGEGDAGGLAVPVTVTRSGGGAVTLTP